MKQRQREKKNTEIARSIRFHRGAYPDYEICSQEQALSWNSYLACTEYRERRLTWGTYTNTRIRDLPDDYLVESIFNPRVMPVWQDYLIREFSRRYPGLKRDLLKKLGRR